MASIRKSVAIVLIAAVHGGCLYRFGERSDGIYGVSNLASPDPKKAACIKALNAAKKDYDSFTSRTEVLLYASVVLGVATTVVTTIQGLQQPGEGAMDVPEAISKEGDISALEWTSIGLAGGTALGAGLTTAFATLQGKRLERMNKIVEVLRKLEGGIDPGLPDLVLLCGYQETATPTPTPTPTPPAAPPTPTPTPPAPSPTSTNPTNPGTPVP